FVELVGKQRECQRQAVRAAADVPVEELLRHFEVHVVEINAAEAQQSILEPTAIGVLAINKVANGLVNIVRHDDVGQDVPIGGVLQPNLIADDGAATMAINVGLSAGPLHFTTELTCVVRSTWQYGHDQTNVLHERPPSCAI